MSATVGTPFTFAAATNAPSGNAPTITAGSTLLPNMTFNAGTNTFSGWTPTSSKVGTTQSFPVTLSDSIGNSTTVSVFVSVAATSNLSVFTPPTSLVVGSPVLVAFNDANPGTPAYSVTTSNPSALSATIMKENSTTANPVLQIVTNVGTMDIELLDNYTPNTVAHIESLVNSGAYATDATFYRIIEDFMVQGGVGGTGSTIPVELNADLRFTSSGLLAMANNGVDGNSSEFFITGPDDLATDPSSGQPASNFSDGFLDFRYTIFGKLIEGDNVRQALAATQVGPNSSGEDSEPFEAPQIESMSIVSQPDAGVFLLKAASTASGPYTVTVTDGLGGSQTFIVNVGGTNPYDPPNPWVAPINGTDTITTAANTAAKFTPVGESANDTPPQIAVSLFLPLQGSNFSADLVDNTYTGTSPAVVTPNPYMTLTHSGSSYTVTPTSGFYGVQVLEIEGQAATAASWDSSANVNPVYRAFVPVYVDPPTPQIASISVGGQTVSGSTFANNSSVATELSFHISGAVAGATVSVYVNGGSTPIATGTAASAGSITLTTNGTTTIADGNDVFTVEQSIATSELTLYADWTSTAAPIEFPIAANTLSSPATAGTALTVGLAILVPPITTAQVGVPYTYVLQTNAPAADVVTVTQATLPPGMQLTGNTFTWTPTSAQVNQSFPFSFQITESAGRTGSLATVNISVILGVAPVEVPVNTSVGGNVTVSFSGSQVEVYDNVGKAVLSKATFKPADAVTIELPSGQANSVAIDLPGSPSAAIPKEILVQGLSGSTADQVTVVGSGGANAFTLAGGTVTANGLPTVMTAVQKLTLQGGSGNDYYTLNSSSMPTSIVDPGGYNTFDFSHDAAGVTVNLGLDKGQPQAIAPWNTTLSIYGVINKLIGTAYADALTGGPAAMTENILRQNG